jgi:mRNA interferase MazF
MRSCLRVQVSCPGVRGAEGQGKGHRGDAIWINLQPQAGHEQAGRRPAVVLSPSAYNGREGLALLCPITNRRTGYPFEVHIPSRLRVTGVVLTDQIKSLDWRGRQTVRVR